MNILSVAAVAAVAAVVYPMPSREAVAASPPPVYDLSAMVEDHDGTPVRDDFSRGNSDGKCGDPAQKSCLTVAGAVVNALDLCTQAPLCPAEKTPPSPEEKYHREDLARTVHSNPSAAPIGSEDRELIKKLVGEMYSPIVVWTAYNALSEPKKVSP
jgi:hypothetical protein